MRGGDGGLVARSSGGRGGHGAETNALADLRGGNLLLKEVDHLGNVGGNERLALASEGAKDGASLVELSDNLLLGGVGLQLLLGLSSRKWISKEEQRGEAHLVKRA